ncbi:hypothetical protein OROHE_019137 [Orobanche hederae]
MMLHSALLDSRNKNPMTVSKPIGNSLLMANNECSGEVVKISATKSPITEYPLIPPRSNAGSGHIVYVRRKPEIDLTKSIACDTHIDTHLVKSTELVETTQRLTDVNKSIDVAQLHKASSPSFSSTRRSVSPSLGNNSSAENVKHACVNCSTPSQDPVTVNVTLWEERYCRLQSLLKMLDQSGKHEYVQMLRSLSSIELSRHAFELEKRSIQLSVEEAKEIQRAGFFDVLGKCGDNNICGPSSSTQQEQLQK